MSAVQAHNSAAQPAVVFLHGFQGSPHQFDFLNSTVREAGYIAYPLVLPGHGGEYRVFLENGRAEWLAFAEESLRSICARHTRVLLVGHSMGGLLNILATLQHSGTVCGLFCLALPLHLQVSFKGMRNNIKYATGLGRQDAFIKAAREFCGVTGVTLWNAPLMARQLLGLVRLSADARRALNQLNVPLIALHSQNDEWVSKRSVVTVRDAKVQEVIVLPESGHFLYPESDRAIVCEAFSRFASACFSR